MKVYWLSKYPDYQGILIINWGVLIIKEYWLSGCPWLSRCVLEVIIINFSYDMIFEPIIMLHSVFLEIQVWLFETSECQK